MLQSFYSGKAGKNLKSRRLFNQQKNHLFRWLFCIRTLIFRQIIINYLGKVVSLFVPVVSLILEVSVPLFLVDESLPVLNAELSVWFIIDESAEVPVDDCEVSQDVIPIPITSRDKKMILFINYFLMFQLPVNCQ